MMKAAERNEVLEVVVTANGSMVAVVQLHNGGGAAGPGTGAIASVHCTTEMWSDCGGTVPEVKWVTVVVFEHCL
jgi:hypothetical protein